MKVREAIRLIEDDGWLHIATRGSHRQFKHPTKPGRVTIAGKPFDDLARGTERSEVSCGKLDWRSIPDALRCDYRKGAGQLLGLCP